MNVALALLSDAQEHLQSRCIIAPRMNSVLALAISVERPLTTLVQRTSELLQEILFGLPQEVS